MSIIVVNMTSIMFSTIICIIVLIFRVGLSKLFTSDSEVIEAVSHLTPLLAISVWLNGIQPILSGNKSLTCWLFVQLLRYRVLSSMH